MKVFPAMLNLVGRRAVVVGAGPVALAKAEALRHAGAAVRLVAPDIPADVLPEDIEFVRDTYQPANLENAAVVFACTDDEKLNNRIADDARRAGALANAADQPQNCDFFSAATITDGPVAVAVSTGGASPVLAKRLKQQLAKAMPHRIGEFAELLDNCRCRVQSQVGDPARRKKILTELASDASYELFIKNGPEAIEKRLDELLQP